MDEAVYAPHLTILSEYSSPNSVASTLPSIVCEVTLLVLFVERSLYSMRTKSALLIAAVFIFVSLYQGMNARNTHTNSANGNLGIINIKGKWVIPPRYEQIVYAKQIDCYWVKDNSWELLDRNGAAVKSELPAALQPVATAASVTTYPDVMLVSGPDGLGYSEPTGRPLTKCIYTELYDVGDQLWMVRERSPLAANVSGDGALPTQPPLQLLDHSGTVIGTLPSNAMRPEGKFVDGVLCCAFDDGSCETGLVDRTGHRISGTSENIAQSRAALGVTRQNSDFNCIYEVPVSKSKPIKFVDMSNDGADPKWFAPIAITGDMAIVYAKSGEKLLSGLVNRNGKWLLKPKYDRLTYCDSDRLIASKS